MSTLLVLAACSVAGCGFDTGAHGNPDQPTTQARQNVITIFPRGVDLVDFPLAVVIDEDGDLAAHASSDGSDILFTADGTHDVLAYELESFDSDTGALVAWVVVPAIDADDGARIILRFDDPHAVDRQDPAATWPEPYAGVWHLSSDPVAMTITDSTRNGNDGLAPSKLMAPDSVAGIAGNGLEFSAISNHTIRIAEQDDSLDFGMDSYSVSMWVLVDLSIGAIDSPWSKGGTSPADSGYLFALGQEEWTAQLVSDGVEKTARFGLESTFLGNWTQLVAVIDRRARQLRTYTNGALAQLALLEPLGPIVSTADATLGGTATLFNGRVDEIRVHAGSLDPAVISASYANLATPGEFYAIE